MIDVQVNEKFESLINAQLLETTAQKALMFENQSDEGDLSIVIDGDEALQSLNLQFRDIDAPTDVLSFSSDEIDPESGQRYFGDIVISYPRARAQADLAGHDVSAELQLLVIHGVLHLLGHDHGEPEEKARMWQSQKAILDSLGVSLKQLPE